VKTRFDYLLIFMFTLYSSQFTS